MFPMAVLFWRPQILRYVPNPAGGIDYWLAWIEKESGGNPCSWTSLRESGLFQLMPPDNTNRGGTTEAALRAACVDSSQKLARSLTDADVRENMVSFEKYLAYITGRAREKLIAAGVPWSPTGPTAPSFWSFVKLQHAYPAPSQGWLSQAVGALGRPPADWKEFRSVVPPSSDLMRRVLDNAEAVGFHGRGGISPVVAIALVAGAGLLYYLARSH